MARVICYPDGSTDVLLSGGLPEEYRLIELESIMRERLGDDFMQEYRECTSNKPEITGDDYERICDGYHARLHDTLDELRHVLNLLEEPRINRRKLVSAIEQMAKSINNEL